MKDTEKENTNVELNLEPKVFQDIATGQACFIYLHGSETDLKEMKVALFREYVEADDVYTGRSAKVLITQVLDLSIEGSEIPDVVIGFRPPVVVFHQAPLDAELVKKVLECHKLCNCHPSLPLADQAEAVLKNLMNSES